MNDVFNDSIILSFPEILTVIIHIGAGLSKALFADRMLHIENITLPHFLPIDPATDNHRAIACYKKVGFTPIGEFIVPYGPMGNGPGPILLMMYKY